MNPSPSHLNEKSALWEIKLPPLKHSDIEIIVTHIVGDQPGRVVTCDFAACLRERRHRFAKWENFSTRFSSDNSIFDAELNTAISDFYALQISDQGQRIVGAGITWFASVCGRDSIIAAYQPLSLNPQLAIDTLQVLDRYQRQGARRFAR